MCSKHFEESSFHQGATRQKLKDDSIPTIFSGLPLKLQEEITARLSMFDNLPSITSHLFLFCVRARRKRQAPKSEREENQPIGKKAKMKMEKQREKEEFEAQQHHMQNLIKHDHDYAISSVMILKQRREELLVEPENRCLDWHRKQSVYWHKRAATLGDIIDTLRKENVVSENATNVLSTYGDVSILEELWDRCKKNKELLRPSKDSYSPQLRAFAMTLAFYSAKAYSHV